MRGLRVLDEYNFFSRSVETALFAEIPDGTFRHALKRWCPSLCRVRWLPCQKEILSAL